MKISGILMNFKKYVTKYNRIHENFIKNTKINIKKKEEQQKKWKKD
jgi:uncharacterized protein (UPF0333 family)